MTRDEHVPEVLPAPPETGTEVRPVAGQRSNAPKAVLGRRAQAFGIAAVAVVVIPAALLSLSFTAAPVAMLVWAAVWIGAAAACWLLDARTPRRWAGWALLAAAPQAILNVVLVAPVGLLGLLALVVCPLLARFAHRRFSAPGFDLAELDVEVSFQLAPRMPAQLRIGRDRAVLVQRRTAGGGNVEHAIPLAELALAEPGEVVDADWWPLPGGTGLRLRRAPAVRVVAGAQQWVVHVEDPLLVVAILRRRQTAAWPQRTGPQDLNSWHALRKWAVARTTAYRDGRKTQALTWFRAPLGFAAGLLSTAGFTAVGGSGDLETWLMFTALLALAGYLLTAWLRLRRRLEFAELNQLPPGSPSWGDVRPGIAPIPTWRPWA
jgi:hypothetical protein